MKSKATVRVLLLALFGGFGSWAVAHYDELIPHFWKVYTAPDGAFSIELPGRPTVESFPVAVEGGGSATATTITVQPTQDTAYTCGYVDRADYAKTAPSQVLESVRDGSLAKIQGTVLWQKPISVQGHPGIELRARARENSLTDIRLVSAGTQVYMIMAVAVRDANREPKTIKRLFDSFRILRG